MVSTFKAICKEEKKDSIYELKEHSSNLELDTDDGNKAEAENKHSHY